MSGHLVSGNESSMTCVCDAMREGAESSQQAAREAWHRSHQPENGSVPTHLFTDENPATTIKGTGFRDRAAAEQTIRLTSQEGVRFKQHWTVMAMRERAAHHPHQTAGMREAIQVFEAWLREYVEPDAATVQRELQAYRKLWGTVANQSAYQQGSADEERHHIEEARKEEARGRKLLLQAVLIAHKQGGKGTVPLDLGAFTAVFGGPWVHGYGEHKLCGEEHEVTIHPAEQVEALLGAPKRVPIVIPETVRVVYAESGDEATVVITLKKGVRRLEDMWRTGASKKRPRTDVAVDTEPGSSQDALLTLSDSTETRKESVEGSHDERPVAAAQDPPSLAWACGVCTLLHDGHMVDYLACHACGSERRAHAPGQAG